MAFDTLLKFDQTNGSSGIVTYTLIAILSVPLFLWFIKRQYKVSRNFKFLFFLLFFTYIPPTGGK